MGIDIYARWSNQTDAETQAQKTGFSAVSGDVGYLREAYHGGPYVTKYLVAEAFDAPEAPIAAATLRSRLPAAVLMHLYREHKLYGDGRDPAHIDFDKLATTLDTIFTKEISDDTHDSFLVALKPESVQHAETLIASGMLPDTAKAFVDFVALCERKEQQTGEPCIISASY